MKKLAIGIIVLLLLTCSIGLVTAENQSMEYTAINAALSPVGGEFVYSIPPGSVIYHSTDGITTVYTAEGKCVLKARDSDAAMVLTGLGPVPATKVHDVPNGSRFTIAPGKFYTKDRGWIAGNTTKTYAPDGTLVLTVIHEKLIIKGPIIPAEGEGTNYVPPGSVIYSADGITTAYAPDGKILWKARDSDVPTKLTGFGPKPVTHLIGLPSGSYSAVEPIKFYTEDRGWMIGNATKDYGPDGTHLISLIHVKTLSNNSKMGEKENFFVPKSVMRPPRKEAEFFVPKSVMRPPLESITGDKTEKMRSSEFSGWIEWTEDEVSTLQEFTAYWDCPSAPPSPHSNTGVLLFNAITDDTGWSKIAHPLLMWHIYNGRWLAYSQWGPDEPDGDYYRNSTTIINVDAGDKLKGELNWEDGVGWHICIYNLDEGTHAFLIAPADAWDNTDLTIFTALEAEHVHNYADLPGDTTFYDMVFKDPQGSPVDIEWEKEINDTAKELIPELGIIVYSDSKVKLVTRGTSLDTNPLDVILVTDLSGSMGSSLSDAKTAAKTFVDQLSGQDKVGLVSFTSTATLDRHLTSDFDDVKNVIDGYSASGGTNMGAGLTEAINELEANGSAESIHTIIVLSDGYTIDEDEILNTIVPQAVSAGITIYTFGYDGAKEDFLTQVATAASGEYHFEPDSATLTAIYTQLSQSTPPEEEYEGPVGQDETAEETNWLDKIIDFFKIILHWEGSDLDLTIIDPNGTVIEPGMPGVFYSGNDTYPEYYEVHNPMKGNWTIQIYGKNVTGEYENYIVTVFHPGALMYVKPTKWDIDYPTNKTIIFNVSEIGGMNDLTNVTFTASDLVEVDAGAAAARKAEMEAHVEAERELEEQRQGQVQGKRTISTQSMSLLHLPQEWISRLIEWLSYFSPETVSSKPLESQTLSGNTIPASSFSFSSNNFNVTAGGSQDVSATLTIPPDTQPGNYSGTINVTSDNGNSATIMVTVQIPVSGGFRGGVYFEQQGWSQFNSMERTFDNVPPGIKIARVYTGFWQGSPGKGGFFNITIQNNTGSYTTDTYRACDPCPNKTNCVVDGHQRCRCDALNATPNGMGGSCPDMGCIYNLAYNYPFDRVNMHDYITGCGVQFVSFDATPYINEGTNTITVNTEPCSDCCKGGWDGRIYLIALLVVYENASMPEMTYWINEGAPYMESGSECDGPENHHAFSFFFNGTYVSNPAKVKYWTLGFPHVANAYHMGLNYHSIGYPDHIESHDSGDYEVLLRWDNIPTSYLNPDNSNLFDYYDYAPYYERVNVAVLMVQGPANQPDLTVTDIKPNTTMMRPGKNYMINATLTNQGNTSGAFNVSFEVDGSPYGDEKRVSGLAADASTTVSFEVNLAYGCHNFKVVANCNNEINEENELNNNKTANYQVGNVIVVRSKSDFDALTIDEEFVTRIGDTYYIEDVDIENCAGRGIDIQTDAPFVIRNCTVHDCMDCGIYLHNVTNGKVNDSEVYGNGGEGIRMMNSSYVTIDNNYVHDNEAYGIGLYPARMPYPDCEYITITNNELLRNYYGIELFGSNCTIRHNLILNSTAWGGGEEGYGIYVVGYDSEFYNNTIKYSDSYGMYMDYDRPNLPTVGNVIYGNSFIDNNQWNPHVSQAYDSGDNYWNSTEKIGYYVEGCPCAIYNYIGNYWSDY